MPKPRKAFGQHTNAEISSSLADTDVLMQTMIEVRGGGKKYEVLFGYSKFQDSGLQRSLQCTSL